MMSLRWCCDVGIPVLVIGESGTGKSASLRNFTPESVGVINISGKPLPFRNKLKSIRTDDWKQVVKVLKGMKAPSAVVDDFQYLIVNEYMRRSAEIGYQKYTEMAQHYWQVVQTVINDMPDDKIVFFLSHIDRDQNGNERAKTIGKLLDEKVTVEGLFTIVLKTHVQDGRYTFLTQNSGNDTVKSPIGMFAETEIDNDLSAVDAAIRDYYNFGGN